MGIDINVKSNKNLSCMEYALANNCLETIKYLWECGASLKCSDGQESIYDRARHFPQTDEAIKEFLLEKINGEGRLKETRWSRKIIQEEFYIREFLHEVLRLSKDMSSGWLYYYRASEWNDFPEVEYKTKPEIDLWIHKCSSKY